MATESYIQLPSDGTGKKTRTHSTSIGGQEVHQQIVKVADQGDDVINPSTEETLQSVLSKLNDVLTQLQSTLNIAPVKILNSDDSLINPATLESIQDVVNSLRDIYNSIIDVRNRLDEPLDTSPSFSNQDEVSYRALVDDQRHVQTDIVEILDILLRTLLNSPLVRVSIDSAGRLRTLLESSAVSQSGAWSFPTYSSGSAVFQLANIEYNECQRSKFTFT